MNYKLLIRRVLSTCLCVAVFAAYTSVSIAAPGTAAGELYVSGVSLSGETPSVIVNGEPAKSGRSIFTSSNIATSENTTAVINLGKLGSIELAPESNFSISFNDNSISGELTSGKLTVLASSGSVNIKTAEGKVVNVNSGESVLASGSALQTVGGGSGWVIFGVVLAATLAVIVYTATQSDFGSDDGTGSVVSPTR